MDKKSILTKLEVITKQQENELEMLLKHLEDGGIIGEHQGSYYLLEDQKIFLGRVFLKTRNFVVMKKIPSNEEAKVSGKESSGLLVGDLVYAKEYQQGIFHCLSYYKAVETLKGRYSLDKDGKEQLLVEYLNSAGYSILVNGKSPDIGFVNQGDLVQASIQSLNDFTITVTLDKLLVHADEVGSDISMIISKNDAALSFPDKVMEEAKALPSTISDSDKKGRHDFTEDCVVTIDGDDAHDFDDAVSIKRFGKGYEVVVHIADVTEYVKPNHPLDDEALVRGTSIYVADRVVPMLPFELSNGICSLNPNEERLVLSVTMDVDTFGNVFNYNIEKGFIRSHGRLTYNKVNSFWNGEECEYSDEIKDSLNLLKECSDAIRKRRERQGAMKLSSTELKFHLDEKGHPTDVTKEVQGPAEKMIEDLMIIANCTVAKALKTNKIPVLYRVHELPPEEKFTNFKEFIRKMDRMLINSFPKYENISGSRLNDFLSSIKDDGLKSAISYMMLRSLAKARYSPEELGHFGLAELYYCHFTSPIRRYPDDIIHRLVKDYLIEKKNFNYEEVYASLENLGDITSAEEVKATAIEREVDDLESAKYMTDHIGEEYHGHITGLVQRGMFIQLDMGIEGFLAYHCMHDDFFRFNERSYAVEGRDTDISFTIGTEIDVKVLASNPKTEEIDFATPEFYDRFAADLDEEEREKMSLNGVHLENEDDFVRMTAHPEFPEDDYYGNEDYEDDDYDRLAAKRDEYDEYEDDKEQENGDNEFAEDQEMKKKIENTEEVEAVEEVKAVKKTAKKATKAKKAATEEVKETVIETTPVAEETTAVVEEKPAKKAKKTTKKAAAEAAPEVEETVAPEAEENIEDNQKAALDQLAFEAPQIPEDEEESYDDERDDRRAPRDDGFRPSPEQWKEVDIIRAVEAKFDPRDPESADKIDSALEILGITKEEHAQLERFTKPREGGRGGRSFGGRGGFGHGGDRGGRGGYGHSDRGGFGGRGGFGHSDRGGFSRGGDRGGFSRGGDRGGYGHSSDRGGFGHSDRGGDRGGFSRGGDRGGFSRGGDRGGRGGYGHSDRGGYERKEHTGYGSSRGGYGRSRHDED